MDKTLQEQIDELKLANKLLEKKIDEILLELTQLSNAGINVDAIGEKHV